MKKECQYCDKKFEVTEQENLFCSVKCRIIKQQIQKKYREEHKEERKAYYQEHKQEIIEQQKEPQKQYKLKHKQKILEYLKQYQHKRLKNDINFKLKYYLRNRVYSAIKGFNKSGHIEELIGCTVEDLKKHLESKFKEGMSWYNYGKWEIDHIRPCASFDLKIPEEQRKCFNYSNLQPLWQQENRIKHDKLLTNPQEITYVGV